MDANPQYPRREYRRWPKADTWHFHPGCHWWPVGARDPYRYDWKFNEPTTGKLCNICLAKEKREV